MAIKKNMALNIIFALFCAGVLVFLLSAPKETTPHLPHDATHEPFFAIESKKEAEKNCLSCHGTGKEAPLPEKHPPKYRCLFCHKRQ